MISDIRKTHTTADFVSFLNRIDRAVPKGRQVHLILDNLSAHKTPRVQRWLLRHRRFHLHFTPTYSSWVNLVERWFSALTTKLLQRSTHNNTKELTADINNWIDLWNKDPNPYVWVKTADEILDKIGGYCAALTTQTK